eukprot:jgi/Tetstr1/441928/TSEL_030135.t1
MDEEILQGVEHAIARSWPPCDEVKAVKSITPVKTRFTNVSALHQRKCTWSVLKNLTHYARDKVVDGGRRHAQTASNNLRSRKSTYTGWAVTEAIESVISHPCKVVKLAQSNGNLWLLSNAMYSIAKLESKFREIREKPVVLPAITLAEADEEDENDASLRLNNDRKGHCNIIIDTILEEVEDTMAPFRALDADRQHELGPRFCSATSSAWPLMAVGRFKRAMMRRFTTEALLPMLIELKLHMESEEKSAITQILRVEVPIKRRLALDCYKNAIKRDVVIRTEVQEADAMLETCHKDVSAELESGSIMSAHIGTVDYIEAFLSNERRGGCVKPS